MMCHHIFSAAGKKRKELDAPTRLQPRCHPKSKLDVYVDSKHHTITLCCSRCDQVVDRVKVRKL